MISENVLNFLENNFQKLCFRTLPYHIGYMVQKVQRFIIYSTNLPKGTTTDCDDGIKPGHHDRKF